MLDKPKSIQLLSGPKDKSKMITEPEVATNSTESMAVDSPLPSRSQDSLHLNKDTSQTTTLPNFLPLKTGVNSMADMQSAVDNIKKQIISDSIAKIEPHLLPKYQNPSVLYIDMRSRADFQVRTIQNAINPSFPALVVKRFRKNIFSSFNLVNFLSDPKCQSMFNSWRTLDCPQKTILVFDDKMDQGNFETDAWALLTALSQGLGSEFCPNQASPVVGFITGGFTAVQNEKTTESIIDDKAPPGQAQEEGTGDASPSPLRIGRGTNSVKLKSAKSLNLRIRPTSGIHTMGAIDDRLPTAAVSPDEFSAPQDPLSRITNSIFIGSDLLPSSEEGHQTLADAGVTHILNMAAEIKPIPSLLSSGKFIVKWIPILDNTEVDMDDALQEAIEFIDSALKGNPNNKIFVHCKAGRSRSVSVVIGYLVKIEKYTLKGAYEVVKRTRKGVSPNLGFMAALLKLELNTHGDNSKIADLY